MVDKLKFLKLLALGLLLLTLVFLLFSTLNHKIRTGNEVQQTSAPGTMVEVNGCQMHVYGVGEGSKTLVLMAGSGTSAPTLDFKPLWSKLSPQYRIVVVERAGYGFSDLAQVPRDIGRILADTRQALASAGEIPPYVLVPHSMSALEAIHWAQHFPQEVTAIIGIDPAIPEVYDYLQVPPVFVLRILSWIASAGFVRLVPGLADSPDLMSSGALTEEDKTLYRQLLHRRTLTGNMMEELKEVKANAELVQQSGVPQTVPMLFFSSDGKDLGVPNWSDLLKDYTEQLERGRFIQLDAGHYLHHLESRRLAEEVERFLEDLL